MTYIVMWNDASMTMEQCSSLEAAVQLAETLRNGRGITEVRIGRFEDIPFQFTARYEVDLVDAGAAPTAPSTTAPVGEPVHASPDQELTNPVPAPPASGATVTTEHLVPRRIEPGELRPAEVDEMVAVDEGAGLLSAEDELIQHALARRDQDHNSLQRGLFGR